MCSQTAGVPNATVPSEEPGCSTSRSLIPYRVILFSYYLEADGEKALKAERTAQMSDRLKNPSATTILKSMN